MNLEEFRSLFARAPDKFPSGLAERYPRLLQQILSKWDAPTEMVSYLNELVVDQRGNRQGFPSEILQEILFISTLFERWRSERKRKAPADVLASLGVGKLDLIDKQQKPLTPELLAQLQGWKVKMFKDDPAALANVGELVNQRDRDGMTLLMHAAAAGAEKCLLQLLKIGANPHVTDPGGNRSIHWAVTMSRLRATEILLFFGAEPNAKNAGGVPALSLAAIKHDPAIASRLIDYGVDPNTPDGKGDFPLHKAVVSGSPEMVKFLLNSGASKDMKNREGKTPHELALSNEGLAAIFHKHQSDLIRNAMQK
jgi:hypothetical protein